MMFKVGGIIGNVVVVAPENVFYVFGKISVGVQKWFLLSFRKFGGSFWTHGDGFGCLVLLWTGKIVSVVVWVVVKVVVVVVILCTNKSY